MKKTTSTLKVTIPRQLHAALRDLAWDNNITIREIVITAITAHVKKGGNAK